MFKEVSLILGALCSILFPPHICKFGEFVDNELPPGDKMPLVETDTGPIAGQAYDVMDGHIFEFLGIPYAKPPVGDKRFSKPEPVDKWQKVLNATKEPPACMQYSSVVLPWTYNGNDKSEDCLYLNIWTPYNPNSHEESNLAVFVWIHGGSYTSGSARMSAYNGGIMSSLGKVVVVTLNYRLGIFGFLNAGVQDAPGNMGVYDQNLALQWINRNVHKFGGDSNKVTLAGQSVGGMSVGLHMFSPMSKGLIQKAIMQSGTAIFPEVFANNVTSINRSNELSKIVGCSDDTNTLMSNPDAVIKCLKVKDALEMSKLLNDASLRFPPFITPFIGDEFLPEPPIKVLQSKDFPQMPTLIGDVEHEGDIIIRGLIPDILSFEKDPVINKTRARSVADQIFVPGVQIQEIFDFYFNDVGEDDSIKITENLSHMLTDFYFICPAMYVSERLDDAYFYWFTYMSSKQHYASWVKATHNDEIPYEFGAPFRNKSQYSSLDRTFSLNMILKWTDFVKKGKPAYNCPKYNSDNPKVCELNLKTGGPKPFPRQKFCKFLTPYFLKELLKASNL